MASPAPFMESDRARLEELVAAHPFALLIAGDELVHVPVLLDAGADRLRTHVARGNRAWIRALAAPVTVVFRGPHGYVSPLWSAAPEEQVPTWNYAVVHAQGRAREMGAGELRRLLVDLAVRFETGPHRWSLDWLDPAFADDVMRGIVGLEIAVDRWEGKFKLSQNRSADDGARVAEALREREPALAALVTRAIARSRM